MTQRATAGVRNPVFAERLYVSWWGWPLPLLAAALLAAEIHMGYGGVRAWLPYVIMLPLTVAALCWLGRVQVAVRDGELWVGEAHLPLEFVGEVEVLPADGKRKALGPQLDPDAFVVHRGWIGPVVRIRLTDPEDPAPYWLVSTRHPDRLVAALLEAGGLEAGERKAGGGPMGDHPTG